MLRWLPSHEPILTFAPSFFAEHRGFPHRIALSSFFGFPRFRAGKLAGGAARLKLGQQIVLPKNTPLANVWLTLLRGIGVPAERHGDSTGVAKERLA